jgi:hypothetical protein
LICGAFCTACQNLALNGAGSGIRSRPEYPAFTEISCQTAFQEHDYLSDERLICCAFEPLLVRMQVPSSLLTPNLHIIVCRYLDQELESGPMALHTEFWVERGMDTAKPSRRALHAEKTMVKTSEAIGRALAYNAVFHGCKTPQEMKDELIPAAPNTSTLHDPAAAQKTGVYFCFQGVRFLASQNSSVVRHSGCCFKDFVMLLAQAAEAACTQQQKGWLGLPQMSDLESAEDVAAALMQHISVMSFEQCHLPHFTVCSPSKGISHHIEASGWVEGRALACATVPHLQIWHVQSFVLLQRCDTPSSTPLRLAFVKHSPDWLRDDLGV